ncbi:MAG TPA: biliverdin-producing heme oxygenase [Puia sp.]|nr:biliverdin-producing heme oxygenase [Puia sp.]
MLLTDELKECTHAAHQATEKKMVMALKRLRSKEDYIRLLQWLYGFYGPMEDLIRRYLAGHDLPAFAGARRSDALLTDILDSSLPVCLELCPDLPPLGSSNHALGALYVLEGSALGGRVIADMVTRQIGIRESLSFFNGYGDQTEERWRTFKDFLDRDRPAGQRQDIITAARETFITFKNWIDKNELQPQL